MGIHSMPPSTWPSSGAAAKAHRMMPLWQQANLRLRLAVIIFAPASASQDCFRDPADQLD